MPFSQVSFTYTGGPQVFPTNFALGVLEEDHVTVTVDGQLDGLGNLRPFAHTYDAGTGEVTITEPLTIGWTGSIFRTVPLDTLIVDFEANADVTKRNLSRATKQVLMAVQEARDERAADSLAINEAVDAVEALQTSIAEDVSTVEAGVAAVGEALVVVSNAEAVLVDAEAATASLTAGLADINSRASKAANLSDLANIDTAQTNLGMSSFFKTLLSWADDAAARAALGLGTVAVENTVPLAKGGTGVSLVDPNADRLLFWDDSAKQFAFMSLGTGLTIAGTTIAALSAGWERVETVYDSAVDGVQAVLETSDFEDGYSYRLVGLYLSGPGTAGTGAEFFRQTSGAYSSIATIGGSTAAATNFTYTLHRPMEAEFYHHWSGEVGTGFTATPTNGQTVIAPSPLAITHATAQKISKIRITRPSQTFNAGKLYLERQRVS